MLGVRVGVSKAAVSDWETDKSPPELRNLIKVAIELAVRFEWLATGRGEMTYTGVREESPDYGGRDPMAADLREMIALWKQLPVSRQRAVTALLRAIVNPTVEESLRMLVNPNDE